VIIKYELGTHLTLYKEYKTLYKEYKTFFYGIHKEYTKKPSILIQGICHMEYTMCAGATNFCAL
jgi:hypothetical protein